MALFALRAALPQVLLVLSLLLPSFSSLAAAQSENDFARNFTISNGQIYTPGLAILNSPQPGTPMGGDDLHISLDVTTNGKMPLPPYADDSPTQIFNITVFLSSYDTGRNFTITNGTASENNETLGDIMRQQPGSTVKHIDWIYPDCLVGDGAPDDSDSDRGLYNISIRQNFRLNDEDHYTIFDVPILVTNSIEDRGRRPACEAVDNPLLDPEEVDVEGANADVGIPFAPGDSTEIEVKPGPGGKGDKSDEGDGNGDGDELGPSSPEARPEDGLGGAVTMQSWTGAAWLCAASLAWTCLAP